jgi:hypothetical protein
MTFYSYPIGYGEMSTSVPDSGAQNLRITCGTVPIVFFSAREYAAQLVCGYGHHQTLQRFATDQV